MAIVKRVINIIVKKTNRPPIIAEIPDKTVKEGQLLEVSVSATDPDGDPITLTANNLPDGAVFEDNGDGTGVLFWTPTFGQAGNYAIEITADDGVE